MLYAVTQFGVIQKLIYDTYQGNLVHIGNATCKKILRLSERLVSLGIIWAPLNPSNPHNGAVIFQRFLNDAEGHQFLPDNCYTHIWSLYIHTEKYFRNLLKSNRNRIVFTFFQLIWNSKWTVSVWFQINRKIVNTIWFRFDLIRFRKISP